MERGFGGWREQAVQAGQITFEDFFMSDASMQIAPLKIVGFEGLFGSLMMIVILLPICQFLPGEDGQGFHEDTVDSLHVRRFNSGPAFAVVVAIFFCPALVPPPPGSNEAPSFVPTLFFGPLAFL